MLPDPPLQDPITLLVKIDKSQRDALRRIARKLKRPVPDLVRDVIGRFITKKMPQERRWGCGVWDCPYVFKTDSTEELARHYRKAHPHPPEPFHRGPAPIRCRLPGCGAPIQSGGGRGLCARHYQQDRRRRRKGTR